MKKQLLVASAAFFLVVTPAYAAQSQKNNENRHDENRGQVIAGEKREDAEEKKVSPASEQLPVVVQELSPSPVVLISPTVTSVPEGGEDEKEKGKKQMFFEDDCESEAEWKNHGDYVSCVAKQQLGGEKVSDAARSDIGKEADDDDTISVTPSVSPSLSPTLTPPLTSPEAGSGFRFSGWDELKKLFEEFFRSFPFGNGRNN